MVSPSCDAGVGQFTSKVVGCGFTNFSDGLAAATSIVGASTNSRNVVFFLSDGLSNRGGGTFDANLTALGASGATVHTFAVGSGSSCLGGTAGTLQEIADDTGGTCTEVISPADLPDTIPDLFSSSLDSLVVTLVWTDPSAAAQSMLALAAAVLLSPSTWILALVLVLGALGRWHRAALRILAEVEVELHADALPHVGPRGGGHRAAEDLEAAHLPDLARSLDLDPLGEILG